MKTCRKDIKRDNRETKCLKATLLGYSTYTLKPGDLFSYRESYTDGTSGTRFAKCHGRVRPLNKIDPTDKDQWLILAQAASDMLNFTYERWIDPEDVIEICPMDHASKDILNFFSDKEEE